MWVSLFICVNKIKYSHHRHSGLSGACEVCCQVQSYFCHAIHLQVQAALTLIHGRCLLYAIFWPVVNVQVDREPCTTCLNYPIHAWQVAYDPQCSS